MAGRVSGFDGRLLPCALTYETRQRVRWARDGWRRSLLARASDAADEAALDYFVRGVGRRADVRYAPSRLRAEILERRAATSGRGR